MKKIARLLICIVSCFVLLAAPASAQTKKIVPLTAPTTSASGSPTAAELATSSADATGSAATATPAANIQNLIEQKTDKDITETTTKRKEKLVEFLEQSPIAPLSWYNPLQHAIRRAITNGLPANIVVLMLLFPVIASVISFSRHVVGLKGFGVYTPAVLSVAFVSTGITTGILIFLIILGAAMIMRQLLKRLNMQALPRTAMLLWGVSIVMLLVLVGASFFPFNAVLAISIFPILIIMLLTENFMESQLSASQSEAFSLTAETLVVAIFCSFLIGSEVIQKYVILQPEITLLLVAGFNIIVGRYAGLRLMEWIRFRSIID
jgi:hypothetical protein